MNVPGDLGCHRLTPSGVGGSAVPGGARTPCGARYRPLPFAFAVRSSAAVRRPAGVRTRNFLAENQAICQLDLPAHGETGAVSAAPVAAPADATGRGLDRARLSLLRCPARDRMQVRINRWRAWVCGVLHSPHNPVSARCNARAHHRDRTGDLRIFGPTLKPAELGGHGSYRVGLCLLQRGDRPRGGWSLLPILTDTEFQGMPTPGWTVVAASASCPVDSGRDATNAGLVPQPAGRAVTPSRWCIPSCGA